MVSNSITSIGSAKARRYFSGAGGFGTAHDFDTLAPKFTDSFRALGLTRRGAGESDKPESGYDTGTLVEDNEAHLKSNSNLF